MFKFAQKFPFLRGVKIVRSFLKVSAAFAGLLGVVCFRSASQSVADFSTPTGLGSGASDGANNPSAFERINLFNGRLNYSIPIVELDGRGSAELPLKLVIDNGWMRLGSYISPDSIVSKVPDYNPGYLYSRFVGNNQPFSCVDGYHYTWQKLTFKDQDGVEHEFRDTIFDGEKTDHSANCSSISIGTVFKSVDGSGMTFVSDTPIINNNSYSYQHSDSFWDARKPQTGVLNTANGTKYRIENGLIVWIKDRNGNKTSYEYTLINVSTVPQYSRYMPRVSRITDSLNRQINIEYDVNDESPYGLCDRVTYTGLYGELRVIRISKRNFSDVLRSGVTPVPLNQAFPPYTATNSINIPVVSAIWLSDGISSYKFLYNPYIELARVESPSGTAVEYDYDSGIPGMNSTVCTIQSPNQTYFGYEAYRRLIERRSYLGSTAFSSRSTYSLPESRIGSTGCNIVSSGVVEISNRDSANSQISLQKHYFYGSAAKSFSFGPLDYPSWKEGREYETSHYLADGVTLSQRVLREWKNKVVPWVPDQNTAPQNDVRSWRTVAIEFEGDKALATLQTNEYDETGNADPLHYSHLNLKRSKSYQYKVLNQLDAQSADIATIAGMYSESELAGVTETDYLYAEGYKARGILALVSELRVINPLNSADVLAKSQFVYDEQNKYYSLMDLGTTVGYEVPSGSDAHLRGNITTSKTWMKDDNNNPWQEVHIQYDNFGNPRKFWDIAGDQYRFVETEYAPGYYYAYPTKTITPAPDPTGVRGTNLSCAVTTTYDFHTGRPLSITDANGQTTSVEYDNRLRTKRVNPPAGGKVVEFEYGDTPGNLFLKQRRQIDAQNWAEITTYLNAAGNPKKVQTKDRQGDIFVEVEYDEQGRLKRTTNPYRQGDEKFWSKPRYDAKGRVVESYAPAPDGQTGPSIGTSETGISTVSGFVGHYTTLTDASGRKIRYLKNVYGQLVRVDEPVDGSELGTLANAAQPTFYTYDVNARLIKIQQGQQSRYFMYDSLGRLIRTRQPEQDINPALNTQGNPENNHWTAGYSYDIFGNVLTVTDAKGMVLTNTYDKAGRPTTITYSDGTPTVDYFYDGTGLGLSQPPQYSLGKLTRASNNVSESRYTAFDNLGRIQESQQITDGRTYNFEYKYDSTGNLEETRYPSGRIVRSFYDGDGGLSSVSSKSASDPFRNYASDFDYNAFGSAQALRLGNGLWETAVLDRRKQLTQIGLGNSPTNTSLWRANYEYGQLNEDGSVDAAKNSGLIAKQSIAVPGATFVQTYKYDELNRLEEARETSGTTSGTENWKQTFGYDRYGNRNALYQKVGSEVLPINNQNLPQVDPARNRFSTDQGYLYDFNGNLIQDASNKSYTYDGNDKQTVIRNLNTSTGSDPDANVVGRYYYDGEGKRVKKVTSDEITVFVYDAVGSLAAEYSTQQSSQPETSFITADNLGSPRLITNWSASVVSRRDYMPYGEDLNSGVGARSESLKYSASGLDNIRQRFTGYERDDETNLDFAQNRMYGNRHGRFTTVDPLIGSASLDNPQTLNRYAYVGNNPISVVDPSGLIWCMRNDVYGGNAQWRTGSSCSVGEDSVREGQTIQCSNTGNTGCRVNGTHVAGGSDVFLGPNGEFKVVSPDQAQQDVNQTATSGSASQAAVDPASTSGSQTTELPTAPPTVGELLLITAASAGQTVSGDTGTTAGLEVVGLAPSPVEDNVPGLFIGHGLAIGISVTETIVGGTLVLGGGVGEAGGFVLDLSGIGAAIGIPINIASAAAIGVGAVMTTHGIVTLFNTAARIQNQGMGSPALKGDPYSPGEVSKRQSETRRDLGLKNLDPDSEIPDQPPGHNLKGTHKADTAEYHSTGERNVGTHEEHSRVPKGSNAQRKR